MKSSGSLNKYNTSSFKVIEYLACVSVYLQAHVCFKANWKPSMRTGTSITQESVCHPIPLKTHPERTKHLIVEVKQVLVDPRWPDSVGQIQHMSSIDQEERHVPGQDVHCTNVQSRPQCEEQDTNTQDWPHHQTRQTEVMRHQKSKKAEKVGHLENEGMVLGQMKMGGFGYACVYLD